MNTLYDDLENSTDPLESKISASLNRHAGSFRARGQFDGVAARDRVRAKAALRQRRSRGIAAALSLAALLGAGLAVSKVTNRRVSTTVTTNSLAAAPYLRLLPSWIPPDSNVGVQEGPYQNPERSFTYVWGSKEAGNVWLNVTRTPVVKPLDEALVLPKYATGPGDVFNWWVSESVSAFLRVPPSAEPQLEEIARSLTISPVDLTVTASALPLGLPLRYAGPSEGLNGSDQWLMSVRSSSGLVLVSAYAVDRLIEELRSFGPNARPLSEKMTVRGQVAELRSLRGPQLNGFLLEWSEAGWKVSVSGEDRETVIQVAQGLQTADEVAWAKVAIARPKPTLNPPAPTEESLEIPIVSMVGDAPIDSDWTMSVTMQLKVNEQNCISALIKLPGSDGETICAADTDGRVWFGGQIESGGRRYLVAAVSSAVDAFGVGVSEVPKGIGSSLAQKVTWVEGAVVTRNSGYMWLGFGVLDLGPASQPAAPVNLDLFERHVEDDQDKAESTSEQVEVPKADQADTADVVDDGPVDFPVLLVERVVVPPE